MFSVKVFFRIISIALIILFILLTKETVSIEYLPEMEDMYIDIYSPISYFGLAGILVIVILILWNFEYLYYRCD